MGAIKIILRDDLEMEFRDEVYKQLGMKKGNLTIAVEEAIQNWIDLRQGKRSDAAKKAWKTRKGEKESTDEKESK
jgi:hypothetical protein